MEIQGLVLVVYTFEVSGSGVVVFLGGIRHKLKRGSISLRDVYAVAGTRPVPHLAAIPNSFRPAVSRHCYSSSACSPRHYYCGGC